MIIKKYDIISVENNLTQFKKYLDDPNSDIKQYIGENGIIYAYDVNFSVYSYDSDGTLINSDSTPDRKTDGTGGASGGIMSRFTGSSAAGGTAANFSELMKGANGEVISQVITDSYDVLYGKWAEEENEVMLVLNQDNAISAKTLWQLGLITQAQYDAAADKIKNGETADELSFSYEDACSHTLYLVPACDLYTKNENGTFTKIEDSVLNEEELLKNATELKIAGVIRAKDGGSISTAVAYTSKLTDYIIAHTDKSEIVLAQESDKKTNVLTGMAFESADSASKAAVLACPIVKAD